MIDRDYKIAVVIPCYKVKRHILNVIKNMGPEVSHIYVVDDCCPDGSGAFVKENCTDRRVKVLRHEKNLGVGGAVMTGYRAAIDDGGDVIVKVDGDGQMDPALIFEFVAPILNGDADYTKGNRFFDLDDVKAMPKVRLLGNALLSFMTKLSSGYWSLFDPTNGFTAIHRDVAKHLPFQKISSRYFFETDILFRLNTLRAVVIDIPMEARYGDEVSNLKIRRIVGEFLFKHLRNFTKRIIYNYYLRDMSIASIQLPVGLGMILFGIIFGAIKWVDSVESNIPSAAGTVMLSALPIILGIQFVLSFISHDISSTPARPFHHKYRSIRAVAGQDI